MKRNRKNRRNKREIRKAMMPTGRKIANARIFIKNALKVNNHKVTLNDDSHYEGDRCNTGGCYGFWEEYINIGNEIWEFRYRTTADFEYCPVCGNFGNCNCDREELETYTTQEVAERILSFLLSHQHDTRYWAHAE